MVQTPAPVSVTVAPEIEQDPLALNSTVRPDEAVALTVNVGSPSVRSGSAPNVIVWLAFATLKVRLTGVAAAKPASPGWDAVTAQLPPPVKVTVAPATVQLPEALKVIVRPDDAVALTTNGMSPKILSGSAPNVIVWPSFETLKVRLTGVAAR
jgi:hypothetical protein